MEIKNRNLTPSGQNKLGPSPTRAKDRSRTYLGIAEAMADQWGQPSKGENMNRKKVEQELAGLSGWDAKDQRKRKLRVYANSLGYTENVTGDAVKGDVVIFGRAKFTGSWKNPVFDGIEIISGKIVADSYGEDKQQHTFTLHRRGHGLFRIKGRNLYSIGTFAKPRDRQKRKAALAEKHGRGEGARQAAAERKAMSVY